MQSTLLQLCLPYGSVRKVQRTKELDPVLLYHSNMIELVPEGDADNAGMKMYGEIRPRRVYSQVQCH